MLTSGQVAAILSVVKKRRESHAIRLSPPDPARQMPDPGPGEKRSRMFFSMTVPKGVVDSCCSAESLWTAFLFTCPMLCDNTCGSLSGAAGKGGGESASPPGRAVSVLVPDPAGVRDPCESLAGPPSRCPRLPTDARIKIRINRETGSKGPAMVCAGFDTASVSSTSVSGKPAVGSPTTKRVSSGSGSSPATQGRAGRYGSHRSVPLADTPVTGRPRPRGLRDHPAAGPGLRRGDRGAGED